MKRGVPNAAYAIAVAVASISLVAYRARLEGAERDAPARPALGVQIERVGRPLTGNALLGLFAPESVSNGLKEAYNRAAPADWSKFLADIQRGLAYYDGFDRSRGNQWLAGRDGDGSHRYEALGKLLADDRLWINSGSTACTRFLAVELTALAHPEVPNDDCGGRTPNYDAVDVFRSLLMQGTETGLEDGVDRDDHAHSISEFPFLSPP